MEQTRMQQLKHSAEVVATACDAGNELSLRAYRIRQVCELSGLGRTTIYAAIKSGALIARRYGRCTIILAEDLTTFLRNLPTIR
jgi:excisionase family DNA binding protein